MRIGKFDPNSFGLQEQLSEIERELEARWKVYPRLVSRGSISQETMHKRIATLIAVRDGLRARLAEEKAAQGKLL